MNYRKTAALLTALMTMVSMNGVSVIEAEDSSDITEDTGAFSVIPHGKLGESVSFRTDGTSLIIEGKGDITETFENIEGAEHIKTFTEYIIFSDTPEDEITGICSSTFADFRNLKGVTLSSSVKTIGDGAFANCTSLSSINLPDNLETIGDSAFVGCDSLGEVKLPSGLKTIGESAFWECNKLEIDELPDGLESIGVQAFGACPKITEITIPDSVTSIGERAFEKCTGLKSAVIGRGIKEAVPLLFLDCRNLEELTIPELETKTGFTEEKGFISDNSVISMLEEHEGDIDVNVKKITVLDGAEKISDLEFGFMNSLEEVVIPETVTEIGRCAFVSCRSLRKVNLPSGLKSIGPGALGGCDKLEISELPEGLETIGEQAFSYDGSITELMIPSTVTSIGNNAFEECKNLKDIWFAGSEEQWNAAMAEYTAVDDLKNVTVHFDAVYGKYSKEEIEERKGSGDVDDNGITDITDLSRISLYLIGDYDLNASALVFADMDKDGSVTLADLATLRMILSHKI